LLEDTHGEIFLDRLNALEENGMISWQLMNFLKSYKKYRVLVTTIYSRLIQVKGIRGKRNDFLAID
jgi:hypothetical protein